MYQQQGAQRLDRGWMIEPRPREAGSKRFIAARNPDQRMPPMAREAALSPIEARVEKINGTATFTRFIRSF